MNILLADDELPLLNFLLRGLRAEGHECYSVNSLHEVIPNIKKHSPAVVVLDRMFGSEDSLSIVGAIKSLQHAPMLLLLTAKDEVKDRVEGLQEGADDYLCKPFDFDELLARITALGRLMQNRPQANTPDHSLSLGYLEIHQDERIATLSGEEIKLTKVEYELLAYFLENTNKVLSRERILSRVWQMHADPQTNVVDVYISKLRKKLELDPSIIIETLRGNGYRIREQ